MKWGTLGEGSNGRLKRQKKNKEKKRQQRKGSVLVSRSLSLY